MVGAERQRPRGPCGWSLERWQCVRGGWGDTVSGRGPVPGQVCGGLGPGVAVAAVVAVAWRRSWLELGLQPCADDGQEVGRGWRGRVQVGLESDVQAP